MSFLHHGPCLKCGSKDNRAFYDDGGEYCFGCRDYVRASNRRVDKKPRTVNMDIVKSFEKTLPDANRLWLRQYLDEDQIDEYFQYSPEMDRHVYVEFTNDGDEDSLYWEARSVTKTPKTTSSGAKPYSLKGRWKETGAVVIVEDIVSAIKLSDFVGVICLHGSTIPHALFAKIGNMPGIKRVILWLDKDKLSPAVVYEKKFALYGKETSVVCTSSDPKALSRHEILEILGDAV
jgi:hypothetical protein